MLLGSPSPKDGFAYYALSAPLLLIFSNNAVLVEKIFLLVPMPLMAITMYIFLSYMLKSQYWKFVIALVYSINFITINQFLQQTEWILIAGVLFPLVLLYSFKFVRSPNICYLLILSSLVAIGTAFRIQVFIWFMLFIVVISITNVIEKKSLKYGLKMVLRLALLVGIVFVVVTPIVLIPIISLAQGQTETALSGLAAQSIGYRVKSFYLTFAQTSDLYLFAAVFVVLALLTALMRNKVRLIYGFCMLIAIGLLMTLFWLLKGTNWVPGNFISLLIFYTADYPASLMILISWAFTFILILLIQEVNDRGIFSVKKPYKLNFREVTKFAAVGLLTVILISPIFVYNLYGYKNSSFYSGETFQIRKFPSFS